MNGLIRRGHSPAYQRKRGAITMGAMKIDMKAALAKVAPHGLVAALGSPMSHNLRIGLVWRAALTDTFDGSITDVVEAFLHGVFQRDISRQWDDADPRPVEDRYAWARAIQETGATLESLRQGGTFQGRGGAIRVESRWLRNGDGFGFQLEVEHPDGCQVSIDKHGKLVELRGHEVVLLQWLMLNHATQKWYPTHLLALIQCKQVKGAAPSFGYDLLDLPQCRDIFKEGMVNNPTKRGDVWACALQGKVLAGKPLIFIPEKVLKTWDPSDFQEEMAWLLAPYAGVFVITSKEQMRANTLMRNYGKMSLSSVTKKNSLPPNPLAMEDTAFITVCCEPFVPGSGLSTLTLGPDGDQTTRARRAAISIRSICAQAELKALVAYAFTNTPSRMVTIPSSELPAFPPLGKAECLVFQPEHSAEDKTPKEFTSIEPATTTEVQPSPKAQATAHRKQNGKQLEEPTPVRPSVPPMEETHLPVWDPERGLKVAEAALGFGAKTVEALSELSRHLEVANAAVAAKEQELREALASMKASQAKQAEVLGAEQDALRLKEAETEQLKGRIQQLEVELDSKRTRVRELETNANRVPVQDTAQIRVVDEDTSTVTLGGYTRLDTAFEEQDTLAAELVPVYFTRMTVDISMVDVVKGYEQWLLGIGAFKKVRPHRLGNGLDREWKAGDLTGEKVDLQSPGGAGIAIRRTAGLVVIRFTHGDNRYSGTTWTNLARLVDLGEGRVTFEHAVFRATREGMVRPGYTPVPGIVRTLADQAVADKRWEVFKPQSIAFDESGLPGLIADLLDPDRDVPLVVVSRRRGELLVNPDKLAYGWLGIAHVCHESEGNQKRMTDILQEVGASDRLGCWDGAVRVYFPGFNPNSNFYEHPLFTKTQLHDWTPDQSIQRISRSIVLRSVQARAPKGFFRLVEQIDLETAQTRAEALVGTTGTERLAALEDQVATLQGALVQAQIELDGKNTLALENNRLNLYLVEFGQENESLEAANRTLRRDLLSSREQLTTFKKALDTAGEEAVSGMVPETILRSMLLGELGNVEAIVKVISAKYADRIEFLPSAIKGAQKSEYKHPPEVLDLLTRIVTDYWEGLMNGGDDPAIRVFGDQYAGHESKTLSKIGRDARTFTYKEKDYLMERHLKLTRGFSRTSDREVFRCYFEWFPEEEKFVIGHLGAHLPL